MRLINDDGIISGRELAYLVQNRTELLQCSDNDIAAIIQALQQILGICIDVLCNALLAVHILQFCSKLTINNSPVTDDDNGIDTGGVDQTLGKPCNGLSLTAAGTVPDQIPATHTVCHHVCLTAQNRPQLMEAGEDHIATVIDEHKLADDPQQHIFLQDLFPDVMGAMLSGNHGVTGTLVFAAPVVGQEAGILLIQTGGDKSHHLIQSKVSKGSAIKGENQLIGIPGGSELFCSLEGCLLSGSLLLELDHDNGNTIEENGQINPVRLCLLLIDKLPADREDILFVLCLVLSHGLQARLKESKAKLCTAGIVLHPLVQGSDQTAILDFFAQQVHEAGLPARTVGCLEFLQFIRLRCLQELKQLRCIQSVLIIIVCLLTLHKTVVQEVVEYLISERVFP